MLGAKAPPSLSRRLSTMSRPPRSYSAVRCLASWPRFAATWVRARSLSGIRAAPLASRNGADSIWIPTRITQEYNVSGRRWFNAGSFVRQARAVVVTGSIDVVAFALAPEGCDADAQGVGGLLERGRLRDHASDVLGLDLFQRGIRR